LSAPSDATVPDHHLSPPRPPAAPPTKGGHGPAVFAGFLGWTLDAFDFFLVVFSLTAIAQEFHRTDAEIALSITLTLMFRPVGAFIFGLMADRYGRRLPLMIDLVFYSVVEVATGFAHSFTTFLVLRALFGIGMGGEWGVHINPSDSASSFLIPRALIGMGMGLSFLALNTHLIQAAPRNLVSRVTSLTSAAQQVVTSFSVAGLTTLIVSRTNYYVKAGESRSPEAITHAFHNIYLVLACLAVGGLLCALTLRRPKVEGIAAKAPIVEMG
jgi:MFS family permease